MRMMKFSILGRKFLQPSWLSFDFRCVSEGVEVGRPPSTKAKFEVVASWVEFGVGLLIIIKPSSTGKASRLVHRILLLGILSILRLNHSR